LRNNDFGVAWEVFVEDLYNIATRKLNPEKVNLIVDFGANVGLSSLRLMQAFPKALVIAFEPHGSHASHAAANWRLNGVADRVTLHRAAAGASARTAILTDRGSGSTVAESGEGLKVEILDVFPILRGRALDLVKIDIEGGEYELLDDDRFGELDIGAIVMEWHEHGSGRGLVWCLNRLEQLGFSPEPFAAQGSHGMIWAPRRGTGRAREELPLEMPRSASNHQPRGEEPAD
jgi:FkbM family methyltransferase